MTKPVELFRLAEGSEVFTQTSADYPVTYNSETYASYAIERTQIDQKNELSKASIDLSLDIDNPLAQRYLAQPVDFLVGLTIFSQDESGTSVIWKGRLSNAKGSGKVVTLTFESVFTSLRRPGLRARYQKSCRHALYRRGCGLDPEDFGYDTTVSAMSGLTVTVASVGTFADNRLRGGMIRGPNNVVRFIASHTGTTVTLSRRFETLEAAFADTGPGTVSVRLYPGCAKNHFDCKDFFDNIVNYGGFIWIPSRNPFSLTSIA